MSEPTEKCPPALAGEVWRSPVTPDGSIYAVVRLDDGETLAARLWIGDAWVGVMVSRWLLEGIATECARAEAAHEAWLADRRAHDADREMLGKAAQEDKDRADRWRAYALALRDLDDGDPAAPKRADVRAAWDAVCDIDDAARKERDDARAAGGAP